jgi:hypothetical protein
MVAKVSKPTEGDLSAYARAELDYDEARKAVDAYAYIPRALTYFDLAGFHKRHVVYSVKPGRVVPVLEPVKDYAAAVAAIRERLAVLDKSQADAAASSLSDEHKDLLASDIAISRLSIERVEERLICEAEKRGIAIGRRINLHPLAFLELESA